MSKAALRKMLRTMEPEQLVELILDAYSAHKDTKEYLEFFLNPDVEKLLTKYKDAAAKEIRRTKRGGYSKGRISFLRNLYKEFCAFQPGYEAQMELLWYLVKLLLALEMYLHYPETLTNGTVKFVRELVELADANEMAGPTIDRLVALFTNEQAGTRYFRRFLDNELREYLRTYKPSLISLR